MSNQRAFFDSRAKDWEARCYPPKARARLEELMLEFGVTPASKVLDVGTGPGVLQPYLRRILGAAGTLLAFDISGEMIRQALRKDRTAKDLFFQGDAQHMALPTNWFDHVICFAAFPHFPHPAQALCELARVAKPGGQVVIAHLMSREELARHHGSEKAVADDILPDAPSMERLCLQAGLSRPDITDRPGRYLARARKPMSEPGSNQKNMEST